MGRTLALVLLPLVASGCYLRHGPSEAPPPGRDSGPPRDAGPRPDVPIPPPLTRTVDLLLVIDNSMSMIEEQASLAAEIPRIIDILTTGDFDQDGDDWSDGEPADVDFEPVDELTVGIITTDMGSRGHGIPTCDEPDVGDDGVLRTRGDPGIPGCTTVYPAIQTFRRGSVDPARFIHNVACVSLAVGTDGCGVEQPLEAALKALSPSVALPWTAPGYVQPSFWGGLPGHGDGVNAGFVHPGGVLAIVIVSDGDDCTARDPDLYDPRSPAYDPGVNLRCIRYPDALHSVERYVEGLLQLRRDPQRLVFAPIVGVPVDLAPARGEPIPWTAIFEDDRMRPRVDPENPSELVPSCSVPGRGFASPPVRTLSVARSLESRGVRVSLASICDEPFTGVLEQIIEAL